MVTLSEVDEESPACSQIVKDRGENSTDKCFMYNSNVFIISRFSDLGDKANKSNRLSLIIFEVFARSGYHKDWFGEMALVD